MPEIENNLMQLGLILFYPINWNKSVEYAYSSSESQRVYSTNGW